VRPPRTVHEAQILLEEAHLRTSRRRGQNFLLDRRVLEHAVALGEVRPDDRVLEIGTGLGCLTEVIAEAAKDVVTVEIDHGIAALARRLLAHRRNVTLVEGDALAERRSTLRRALSADVEQALEAARSRAAGRFLVISNLPYSSASPILLALLDREEPPQRIVVLVQKEVARRIVAPPGTRDYSVLGVCVRYFARARTDRDLGGGAFWPPTKVRSTFLVLEPEPIDAAAREAYPAFRTVAAALFEGRRKRASTALGRILGDRSAKALAAAGLAPDARADAVPIEAIRRIAASESFPAPG
jgi:16S rRNA (adenine1518-N6/adenine1519-N6)-dimethyltransferase